MKTLPPLPSPPLSRIIREWTVGDCPKCNSTTVKKSMWSRKIIGCIQPKCENYYLLNKTIMKKFKTRKEILENQETKRLLFELLKEEGYGQMVFDKNKVTDDDELETRINFFIERKLKHCVMEGV